jgi:V/A-type H+-transporting ATPase subunit I
MSKVEIVGPKNLIEEVLDLLRSLGIFHVDPAAVGFIDAVHAKDFRSFMLDDHGVFERHFLETMLQKIIQWFSFIPQLQPARTSYLEPRSIIDSISRTIDAHLAHAKQLCEKRDALAKERNELDHYGLFLGRLAGLVETMKDAPDLDFIGLTIREPDMIEQVRQAISRMTDWKFELLTDRAEDGTVVGLITVEKELSDKVKKSLSDEHVPELTFPSAFGALGFSEKVEYVKRRVVQVTAEIDRTEQELSHIAKRWGPIYQSVRAWIEDRLSLLSATAAAFETRMCFFIHGWMPTNEVTPLRKKLAETTTGVVVEEKEMREGDLEKVPIILRNPPYFKSFEVFTRMLPLPAYTSYDPTPFIALFFPVFFGMILGDAGYGFFLCAVAAVLRKKFRKQGIIRDGANVLFVASLYSVFFGVLFGEFFGDLPERLFHLEPLCIERRHAVVPMLFFTLAVGVAHVFLGLVLGAVAGFKKKQHKEAVYKLLNIAIISALIVVIGSLFGSFPSVLSRPVVIAILFLTPFLFFTGGVLAPLELLKSIGNIISYVRIMAIGLTSVLLAFVANNLGGLTGDVITGVVVAGLLHLLNIILGVFSPTIHSLRLHYVEFFSKFMEHGGRRFEPLRKQRNG